jgi:hypothetical protein
VPSAQDSRVIRPVLGCWDLGKHRMYAHILRAVSPKAPRREAMTVCTELCEVSKNMMCDWILNASVRLSVPAKRKANIERVPWHTY